MFHRKPPLRQLLPSVLLAAAALAAAALYQRTGIGTGREQFYPTAPEFQTLAQRHEMRQTTRFLRYTERLAATLTGEPGPFQTTTLGAKTLFTVACVTPAGKRITLVWERRTGKLVSLAHMPHRTRPAETDPAVPTEAQAARLAIVWLQRLEVLAKDVKGAQARPREHTASHGRFRERWRVRSYQHYTGSGWTTQVAREEALRPAHGFPYATESRISPAAPDDLNRSTTDYPQAIARAYLDPGKPNPALLALSRRATRNARGPYETADAIRQFVARRCLYTRSALATPPGADAAAFFLNVSRRGDCDLFATATTLLCRYAGLPARLVTGFSPGRPIAPNGGTCIPRDSDRHAWTEVYFTAYGWIPFDATTPLAPLERAARPGPRRAFPDRSIPPPPFLAATSTPR